VHTLATMTFHPSLQHRGLPGRAYFLPGTQSLRRPPPVSAAQLAAGMCASNFGHQAFPLEHVVLPSPFPGPLRRRLAGIPPNRRRPHPEGYIARTQIFLEAICKPRV
jgi:hypothetical protein